MPSEAELLAPASGIARVLGDSTSDESLLKAANMFDVSLRVVEHELNNPVGRRWLVPQQLCPLGPGSTRREGLRLPGVDTRPSRHVV